MITKLKMSRKINPDNTDNNMTGMPFIFSALPTNTETNMKRLYCVKSNITVQ
jgi:hypothetical protein